jgi:hypothetical protein
MYNGFCTGLLHGRAGRLTAKNGGFRRGQWRNGARSTCTVGPSLRQSRYLDLVWGAQTAVRIFGSVFFLPPPPLHTHTQSRGRENAPAVLKYDKHQCAGDYEWSPAHCVPWAGDGWMPCRAASHMARSQVRIICLCPIGVSRPRMYVHDGDPSCEFWTRSRKLEFTGLTHHFPVDPAV